MQKERKDMSDFRKQVNEIVKCLGGADNISSVSNCMTRLRVTVRDEDAVDENGLESLGDVLGLVHDRPMAYEIVIGPGKCKKYADCCKEMGLGKGPETAGEQKGAAKAGNIQGKQLSGEQSPKAVLKVIGDIFVPLLPGVITAGLCTGIASLLIQVVPGYAGSRIGNIVYTVLTLISTSFMTYITAWAGYRAAERFGATPILGGMLGMMTCLDGINAIALQIGLYQEEAPLQSVLRSGRGGVLAVIFGVLLLSAVEKRIRSRIPDNLEVILAPLLSLLICAVPYILILMPLLGLVSGGIEWAVSVLCLSENWMIRAFTGFLSAALFLPLVASGMHHGLIALYAVQLESLGYITLYPALAMAGAGQVGAALAIRKKAKKAENGRLCSVIDAALPAGILGVGEPLVYGVTLPLGKPFLTAGIGAGFGGALVMLAEVASTTWGPSGVLGVFVMTAGPEGALRSAAIYLAALLISCICGFLITDLTFDGSELRLSRDQENNAPGTIIPEEMEVLTADHQEYRHVQKGELLCFEDNSCSFRYTLRDPAGIHARPAGEIARLGKAYGCRVTVTAGDRSARAESLAEMMELGAVCGTELEISCEGPEAGKALAALKAFFEERL